MTGQVRPATIAAASIVAALATPAAARGFNIAQLLGYGFEVKAAVPAGTGAKPAADVLYLQGRLPSDGQPSVMRCIIQPSAGQDDANCQKVY